MLLLEHIWRWIFLMIITYNTLTNVVCMLQEYFVSLVKSLEEIIVNPNYNLFYFKTWYLVLRPTNLGTNIPLSTSGGTIEGKPLHSSVCIDPMNC